MNFLDSIVSVLTIATLVSSGFNYLVIRPIQKTIDMNTKVLSELMGTGIGRESNEWYVPIEVQSNFGYNKGVSFQLNVKDNKVDGFQTSYKIGF